MNVCPTCRVLLCSAQLVFVTFPCFLSVYLSYTGADSSWLRTRKSDRLNLIAVMRAKGIAHGRHCFVSGKESVMVVNKVK